MAIISPNFLLARAPRLLVKEFGAKVFRKEMSKVTVSNRKKGIIKRRKISETFVKNF